MVGGGSRRPFPSPASTSWTSSRVPSRETLEPSVAHLQRGHLELAAVELAEAMGDHLPGQLLLDSELEQQSVVLGHGPLRGELAVRPLDGSLRRRRCCRLSRQTAGTS